jgi:nucleoside-diphosphate-sugar epimerase
MATRTLVTGGSGYVGACVVEALLASGREVRVLDVLLHGQRAVADAQRSAGVEVIEGDVRDGAARRRALDGVEEVVHLAAVVGDPATARDPATSQAVNVDATRNLVDECERAGIRRFVFASTCSNYGRVADPEVPIAEDGVLAPVSLYAEQKVAVERHLLAEDRNGLEPCCLRFATVYGVASRMRFDLTVNEFTRDLWADRVLEVFGEQFWRPYVHVRDAARAVALVLDAGGEKVAGQVFNVGRSDENYRKLDLVREIQAQLGPRQVAFVRRDEDPRDYKVSFDKVRRTLGFETTMTVPDGIAEVAAALDQGAFGNPFDPGYRN